VDGELDRAAVADPADRAAVRPDGAGARPDGAAVRPDGAGAATVDRAAVADALPGARAALHRALVALPAGDDPAAALCALLEAAGGPDAGNAARVQLERAPVPRLPATTTAADVVAAARALSDDADRALRTALEQAGLGEGADAARRERAAYARRALDARRALVVAVLDALAAAGAADVGDAADVADAADSAG
jgi:hypothetical protein